VLEEFEIECWREGYLKGEQGHKKVEISYAPFSPCCGLEATEKIKFQITF